MAMVVDKYSQDSQNSHPPQRAPMDIHMHAAIHAPEVFPATFSSTWCPLHAALRTEMRELQVLTDTAFGGAQQLKAEDTVLQPIIQNLHRSVKELSKEVENLTEKQLATDEDLDDRLRASEEAKRQMGEAALRMRAELMSHQASDAEIGKECRLLQNRKKAVEHTRGLVQNEVAGLAAEISMFRQRKAKNSSLAQPSSKTFEEKLAQTQVGLARDLEKKACAEVTVLEAELDAENKAIKEEGAKRKRERHELRQTAWEHMDSRLYELKVLDDENATSALEAFEMQHCAELWQRLCEARVLRGNHVAESMLEIELPCKSIEAEIVSLCMESSKIQTHLPELAAAVVLAERKLWQAAGARRLAALSPVLASTVVSAWWLLLTSSAR